MLRAKARSAWINRGDDRIQDHGQAHVESTREWWRRDVVDLCKGPTARPCLETSCARVGDALGDTRHDNRPDWNTVRTHMRYYRP